MKLSTLAHAVVAASAFSQSAAGQSLVDVLSQNNDTLSTLTGLLQRQPALGEALSSRRNLTILAPSNDAFASFLKIEQVAAKAQSDPDFVAKLLMYHVLNGSFPASSFSETPTFAKTLLTDPGWTNVTGGQVVGVQKTNNTVSIKSALGAKCQVVQADVEYDGGVVHVIDAVLRPPEGLVETAKAANLSAVTEALTKANLVNTLVEAKDVTIFAPNNQAFQAIASTTQNLSVQDLGTILKYHVVPGIVAYSSSLKNGPVKTLEGAEIQVSLRDGSVYVNKAKVVTPDVLLSNGVLHVIDSVLNPDDENAASTSSGSSATQTGGGSGSSSSETAAPNSQVSSSTRTGVPRMSAAVAVAVMVGLAGFCIV